VVVAQRATSAAVPAAHTLAKVAAMVALDIVMLLLVPEAVRVDILVAEATLVPLAVRVDALAPAAEAVAVETVVVAVWESSDKEPMVQVELLFAQMEKAVQGVPMEVLEPLDNTEEVPTLLVEAAVEQFELFGREILVSSHLLM
jgi:hypothetical protein